MQGAIRNIESLKSWFYAVGSPYFTLFYSGNVSQVILRNTTEADMDKSWEMLRDQVLHQSEYGRATLQVIVYKKAGTANNPDGRTNIDINPQQNISGTMAGIGSLPVGYVSNDDLQRVLQEHREKWEMERKLEELEARIDNPDDWVEKMMAGVERISGTDFGKAIISRFMGVPFQAMAAPAPINGTPSSSQIEPKEGDPSDTFDEDMDAICQMLQTDDATLARKLRLLIESNPEMAKNLIA